LKEVRKVEHIKKKGENMGAEKKSIQPLIEINKDTNKAELTNKAYAILFENDLLLASDDHFETNLDRAIQYYKDNKFNNSLFKAEREKALLLGKPNKEENTDAVKPQSSWLQEGTYIPVVGAVKVDVPGLNAHSGIINEARLFSLRLKRLAVAIDKCVKTSYTQAIQTQTLVPFAFIGWAWYLPRLTYLIANGLTHTHKKEFFDKNKYKLANDLTWFITGLTTCGITLNWWSKTFSILSIGGASAASTLTASLYLFDVINITLKCNRDINRLTQIKNHLEARHTTEQTSERINQRISLLKQKRRFHVGVATALLVGMTLPLIPVWSVGFAAVGTSIVIGACLTKFYYDRVIQPRTAVSISNEPLKLLLHQLIRHIEKELARMPDTGIYKNKRSQYQQCQTDLRTKVPLEGELIDNDISKVFDTLSKLVHASKIQTGKHKKTTSHTKLEALLAPYKQIDWSKQNNRLKPLLESTLSLNLAEAFKHACAGTYTDEAKSEKNDTQSVSTLYHSDDDSDDDGIIRGTNSFH
jgi:hypothetical protein